MAKDSKTIPLDPNMNSSEDVSAYKTNMLNKASSLTEGFFSSAAPV